MNVGDRVRIKPKGMTGTIESVVEDDGQAFYNVRYVTTHLPMSAGGYHSKGEPASCTGKVSSYRVAVPCFRGHVSIGDNAPRGGGSRAAESIAISAGVPRRGCLIGPVGRAEPGRAGA